MSKYGNGCKRGDLRNIQILYIIGSIIWIIIFFWIKTYFVDAYSWIFLIIPLIVFFINYKFSDYSDFTIESNLIKGSGIILVLLIVDILLNWNKDLNTGNTGDEDIYFRILVVASILIALSLINFCVSPHQMGITQHFKIILQTSALTLLAFSIYIYYIEHSHYSYLTLYER